MKTEILNLIENYTRQIEHAGDSIEESMQRRDKLIKEGHGKLSLLGQRARRDIDCAMIKEKIYTEIKKDLELLIKNNP